MASSFLPTLLGKTDSPIFQSLQKEIDRVFDEFRELTPWNDGEIFAKSNGKLMLKIDVAETDTEVEITAELPGVKLDDLDIAVTENILTIKGEKSSEHEREEKDYHLVERSYGSFSRSIPLSFDIDPKVVKADFANGILTIKIGKSPEVAAKTQKIKISKAS